jgi:hypothetical protein
MELIIESKMLDERHVAALLKEADELTAILVATHKTSKANARSSDGRS